MACRLPLYCGTLRRDAQRSWVSAGEGGAPALNRDPAPCRSLPKWPSAMTYFFYLSTQVNSPAHSYFYPRGIPGYFTSPAVVGELDCRAGIPVSWETQWTFSSLLPVRTGCLPAATPAPGISLAAKPARAPRCLQDKVQTQLEHSKLSLPETQLPFGLMSLRLMAGPPSELANPGHLPDDDKASRFPACALAAGNVLSLPLPLGPEPKPPPPRSCP